MLGLALLGAVHPLLRAAPDVIDNSIDAATTRALAAIAIDPACQLASLSVLALRDGRPLYQAQFGQRSIAAKLPADADTLYRIASVSKLVTTIGVMRLVEAGTLDLDKDVGKYLGFSLRNPHFAATAITLRMLMTHTSSLRDEGGYSWPLSTSLASVITPAMWSASAAPGDYFSYCNLGWGIVGTIMEAATGERFDTLMRRLVLAPLGVRGGYNLAAVGTDNVATLYRKRSIDTEVWDAAGPWIVQADDLTTPPAPAAGIDSYRPGANATPFSPTGGLRISAAGLGVIMQMLMAGGVHGGQRLLQPATIEAMFIRQWSFDPLKNNGNTNGDTNGGLFLAWGLGNQQFADRPGSQLVAGGGFNAVGHLGDAYGLRSLFLFDRASRTGFVVLIGGTSGDPDAVKGAHSPLARVEETILATLWERTRHA